MTSRPADEVGVNGESSSKRRRTSGTDGPPLLRMAFLGPQGTYGHQASMLFSQQLLPEKAELIPCPTISDIWSSDGDLLVMPLENTIHGGVKETIRCLLGGVTNPKGSSSSTTDRKGKGVQHVEGQPRIVADLDLPVDHCLVVRKGTKMEDIRWVKSHEQALGQCSAFLDEHLPAAKRIPYSSTAAAATSLLDPSIPPPHSQANESSNGQAEHEAAGTKTGVGAAISSKAVLAMYPDQLEILHESIQALKSNFTRFILLSRKPELDFKLPNASTREDQQRTFFALRSPSDLESALSCLKKTDGNASSGLVSGHIMPTPALATSSNRYPNAMLAEFKAREGDISGLDDDKVDYLGWARYHCNGSTK